MLDAPRLLLERAREPLYELRFPLPMALRLAPGRDMSRLPMRLGSLLAGGRFAAPGADVDGRLPEFGARLVVPAAGRLPLRLLLGRLPPCRFTCCRALV
jgi:hypothetical protein